MATRHWPQLIEATLLDAWTAGYSTAPLYTDEPFRDVKCVRFVVEASDRYLEMADECVISGEARVGSSGPFFGLTGGELVARPGNTMTCVLTLNLEARRAGPTPEELLAILDGSRPVLIKLQLWDGPNHVYQAESQWIATGEFVDTIKEGLR